MDALRAFATDPALQERMRQEALSHSHAHLSGWHDVLAEDLLPVWQKAFEERGADREQRVRTS
jgi:hypothetical protein